MATHRFRPTHYHSTFGSHEPVLHIADGDTVITATADAAGKDAHNDQVATPGNPQTGPFYVDRAEPGDTVAIHLDNLMPNRDSGYTRTAVAAHLVDSDYVCELPKRELADWKIDVKEGIATLVKPATKLGALTLPLAPMLGCIGVAPDMGQAISTATSAQHGGNMDYRGYVVGVTAYFPVFAPGALIYVGDGHAIQGDGEIVGTGIEVSFDAQFKVHLIKGKQIGWPRGENEQYIFTAGNARPLDQALQHATTEMLRWLQEDYALDPVGASSLLGQCARYDVGNVFDPAYTMICKVPKQIVEHVSGI